MGYRIGNPKYAMAKYGKINRITIPFGDDGLILVTTELDVEIEKLVDAIIKINIRLSD